jgi:succinate dehydrogenase/fumarate reductase flavoprotein subunit
LSVYKYLVNQSTKEVLISARELQLMIQLTLSYHHKHPDADYHDIAAHYAYQIGKTMVPYEKTQEFEDRFTKIKIPDSTKWANQSLYYTRELMYMFDLAKIITKGALNRNESRGAHYKPEFPERNDEDWLKTTLASYKDGEPELSYEEVDTSYYKPVLRNYSK